MAAVPIFAAAVNLGVAQILPADASNYKTVFTAGASGSKVVALIAATDETAVRVLQIAILRSAVNYVLGSISIPIGAGNDGATPSVNMFGTILMPGLPADNDGQPYILLKNGDSLQVKSLTTITAAKTMHLTAIGGDV
jgi:hypothetical protein